MPQAPVMSNHRRPGVRPRLGPVRAGGGTFRRQVPGPSGPRGSGRARRPQPCGRASGTCHEPVHASRALPDARARGPVRAPRGPGDAERPRALHDRPGARKDLVEPLVPGSRATGRGSGRSPGVRHRGRPSPGCSPARAPRRRDAAVALRVSGGEPVRPPPQAPAGTAVPHGSAPTRPGDVLTTGDRPIYRFRSAEPAVPGETLWQVVRDEARTAPRATRIRGPDRRTRESGRNPPVPGR